MKTNNTIETFNMLTFYPMTVPNTGCIATGRLARGCTLTVTGGNMNQQADGLNTFLVEVVDHRGKEPRVVTKRNMSNDDLAFLIEHHRKNSRMFSRRRR